MAVGDSRERRAFSAMMKVCKGQGSSQPSMISTSMLKRERMHCIKRPTHLGVCPQQPPEPGQRRSVEVQTGHHDLAVVILAPVECVDAEYEFVDKV